jgi:hypothetical protein
MRLTEEGRRPNFLVIVADDLGMFRKGIRFGGRLFGYFALWIRDHDTCNSKAVGRRSSTDSIPHRLGMFADKVNAVVWDR